MGKNLVNLDMLLGTIIIRNNLFISDFLERKNYRWSDNNINGNITLFAISKASLWFIQLVYEQKVFSFLLRVFVAFLLYEICLL